MSLRRWLRLGGVLAALLIPSSLPAQTGFRYVHPTDPACGGQSPCYTTIQAAVTAATAGEHVVVQAGTYQEQVAITGKNNTGSPSEADRIVIEADPAAPVGSVVLQGAVTQCTSGHAVRFQQSKFVTLRGLTITGAGGQAVSLLGGNNDNQAIHLERLRLFGNGSGSCDGGITIARGNPGTLVLNSLIYGNGRNGVSTIDADGGPHYLVGNTIHGNQWSGVSVTRLHETFLVNNAIIGNGTAAGSTGGRFGVKREGSTSPQPAGIHLLNNLICGNRLGEIDGPALDATDSDNLTPTGAEGLGVSAHAGCDTVSNVYADVDGADGVANTADDNFTPVTASPLLDAGLDPRTLGLDLAFNPLLEADYLAPAARPRLGTPGGSRHRPLHRPEDRPRPPRPHPHRPPARSEDSTPACSAPAGPWPPTTPSSPRPAPAPASTSSCPTRAGTCSAVVDTEAAVDLGGDGRGRGDGLEEDVGEQRTAGGVDEHAGVTERRDAVAAAGDVVGHRRGIAALGVERRGADLHGDHALAGRSRRIEAHP
jgi:hypothetical protein